MVAMTYTRALAESKYFKKLPKLLKVMKFPKNSAWNSKLDSLLGSLGKSKVLHEQTIEKTNSELATQLRERIQKSWGKSKASKTVKKSLEKVLYQKNPDTKLLSKWGSRSTKTY
jgi:hypothetical protein